VTAGGALVIGLVAGGLCYSATLLRERLKLATGAIQPAFRGAIDGNPQQVVTQLVAVGATVGYSVVSTFVIVKVVDFVLGIRVTTQTEELGLDLAVHGEAAYTS
jgi:Amt family ammonium transporter